MQKIVNITLSLFLLFILIPTVLQAETEIEEVRFIHANFFDISDLEDVIHLEEGEEFEPRMVKLDKILLNNFYRKNGFLLVEVNDEIRYSKDKSTVVVIYTIVPGPRYYYAGVQIKGAQDVDEKRLRGAFSAIDSGTVFDESMVIDARKQVENIYYNSGKPFVLVKTDYHFVGDSLIYAFLEIEEGATIYIKKIEYHGRKLVKKFLLRRELELKVGDKYNRRAMEKTQQNIYGTGLFRFVRLEIDPIANEPQNVTLRIVLQERDARWVGTSFGVAHQQKYGNSAEITLQAGHRNLFGTARSASVHITPSFLYHFDANKIINAENKIVFKFIEPWIGNTRTPGVLQLSYHQYRLPNSADFDLFNSSFEVHHKFEKSIELNGTLSAKFVKKLTEGEMAPNTVVVEPGQSQTYSLSAYGKRDTRPNLFNPKSGSLTDLSLSFSQSRGTIEKQITVGANTSTEEENVVSNYITLSSSWARYQPWRVTIGRTKFRWTLASRVKTGMIFDVAGSDFVPVSERFYAGGATTVRGYNEQLLGPIDIAADGTKVAQGGKLLFLSNIEARIPLFWLFVGEVFIDGGNVWKKIPEFNAQDMRFSAGAGLALVTPLGPIRFDYGRKINPSSNDKSKYTFHLGIYFAF